jgi:hypothetical protein
VVFLQNLIPSTPPIALACWLTFLMSFFILSGILSYCYFLPKEISLAIWNSSKKISLSQDIYTAVIFCIIAFPLMIFFAAFFDWILYFLFNIKEIPEQLAVLFLKMSIGYPFYFFLNMITVVILAPCIEETLFRGFLQSYLKQYFSTKMSIVGTSLSFAFFHYSSEQGIANLSIIGSLFVLALFLGFIYEKRKSLLAPMILHALFNMINIIHLYLSEGFIHT